MTPEETIQQQMHYIKKYIATMQRKCELIDELMEVKGTIPEHIRYLEVLLHEIEKLQVRINEYEQALKLACTMIKDTDMDEDIEESKPVYWLEQARKANENP